ncbi:hypothetical protein DDE82_004615 [Stemphylium lycopersici]|nr:hypothetical protein DDE82_004615 [Stemphylium lycopersici]
MSIRINATVQEARTAANHSQEQWDRFYARQLAEARPEWKRWILIPANEKEQMLDRINARLRAEGIPPVEMIILKWRVSQLLRDIQRKYGTSSGSGSGSPIQVQTAQTPSDSSVQSSSPQRTEHSPSETRPYDPIRDV